MSCRAREYTVQMVKRGRWSSYCTRSKRAAEAYARGRRAEDYDGVYVIPPPRRKKR